MKRIRDAAHAGVEERFLAALNTGKVPVALAREFVEASRTESPVPGPWRFRTYVEQTFDFGNLIGIALVADHDQTDEVRRHAVGVRSSDAEARRVALDLLRAWLDALNRDGAPGWPGATGDHPLEGRALRLV